MTKIEVPPQKVHKRTEIIKIEIESRKIEREKRRSSVEKEEAGVVGHTKVKRKAQDINASIAG